MLGTLQQELILEAKLHQNRAGAPYVQAGFVPAQPNTELGALQLLRKARSDRPDFALFGSIEQTV
jgi:hypothetical protein